MLIRQSAFINTGNKMLKGGLHCHTKRSDGELDPADCIRLHAGKGYDFLALTDHRVYNYENFAPETGLLIIPGMEIDVGISSNKGMCFHTVAIGPDNEKNLFKQDERVDSGSVEDQYGYQPYLDNLKNHGNLAVYCHPNWSRTPVSSFENLQGCFAMEIWNTCSRDTDNDADNGYYWDALLTQGKRVYCVAVDDGHRAEQHGHGWVRVNAEKNVTSVLDALENGAFYASCGPEIYDFYVEDGVAHVKCSPCRMIHFIYGLSPTGMKCMQPGGEPVTEDMYYLPKGWTYIRVVVEDEQGRKAWANPIWLA